MRQLLVFAAVLAIVFFAVGEWRGWYLGIAGQTPILVYKKDHVAEIDRRTITLDHLPVTISGEVRNGTVRVTVIYERPASFQTGAAALPAQTVLERSFAAGQEITIDELVQEGQGDYTIRLEFEDATGLFRVRVPPAAQL